MIDKTNYLLWHTDTQPDFVIPRVLWYEVSQDWKDSQQKEKEDRQTKRKKQTDKLREIIEG